MAFREVTMLEIKEVLRLWLAGRGKKAIARLSGLDRNTVRRYLKAAVACGLSAQDGELSLTDERLSMVLERLRTSPAEPLRGEAWHRCAEQRAFIVGHLDKGVQLTKVHRLLKRSGAQVPYATLHRFAAKELGFGQQAPTIPVNDCKPGAEVQLDTGWMTLLEPDLFGKRRRFRAWIFTAVYSRHRFVYPCFKETTATAIAACEAAWAFFGGVFHVVIPDNTKTIIQKADPLAPLINQTFLEYAQARGFQIDPARVRSPKDKGRVERAVQPVREDCFRGEQLQTIEDAERRANFWSLKEYGMRRHTRTQRLPLEVFENEEKPCLLPAPTEPYDVPLWCDPKVGLDQHAQVAKALYSLPFDFRRKQVRARADRSLVRFYFNKKLIKTHVRQPPGGRSTDENDFPPEKAAAARRDLAFLQRQAETHGSEVGRFARALLDGPLPWTRVRQCFALMGLCSRYGDERVNKTCAIALAADMLEVHRLERMVKLALPVATAQPPTTNVIPLARFLRPASQYALPLASRDRSNRNPEGDKP
jgi:transposase